jgi:outer membrane protein TolC
MKKTLLLLVAFVATIVASAENLADKLYANPDLIFSAYRTYIEPCEKIAKAPKGYKPCGMTMYARHGSRYDVDTISLHRAAKALRLAEKVVEVREQTYRNLQRHYAHARKLEVTGMITKAERLFAEVNQQEALREWETARKEYDVAHEALCSLLDIQALNVYPMSPLFIIDELPDSLYFKNLIPNTNYTIGKLRLEEVMADNRLRISRSTYLPTVALVGKQTLYAHHLPRNLMPRTMIGVGFTWNLFDGLNRETDVRTARLVKESVALGREKAESALGVLVQKLYTELQEAQTEVSTLRATLSLSEELLRIRRKSFDEGMCTSTEVVDAEVMLSQVRMAMLLAYYQFDVSLATLCSICGVPEMFWDLMKKI